MPQCLASLTYESCCTHVLQIRHHVNSSIIIYTFHVCNNHRVNTNPYEKKRLIENRNLKSERNGFFLLAFSDFAVGLHSDKQVVTQVVTKGHTTIVKNTNLKRVLQHTHVASSPRFLYTRLTPNSKLRKCLISSKCSRIQHNII